MQKYAIFFEKISSLEWNHKKEFTWNNLSKYIRQNTKDIQYLNLDDTNNMLLNYNLYLEKDSILENFKNIQK